MNSVDDLPQQEKKLLVTSGLSKYNDLINSNFIIFLEVLNFITHKKFTPAVGSLSSRIKPKSVGSKANYCETLAQAVELFVTPGNPHKLFKSFEQVGKGGFGSVFSASRIDNKQKVAIKRLRHFTEREQWSNFDEIYFAKQCSHKNIISFHECYLAKEELWVFIFFIFTTAIVFTV